MLASIGARTLTPGILSPRRLAVDFGHALFEVLSTAYQSVSKQGGAAVAPMLFDSPAPTARPACISRQSAIPQIRARRGLSEGYSS